jgi:hypothetical protein
MVKHLDTRGRASDAQAMTSPAVEGDLQAEALGVVIEHQRRELEHWQSRIDRTENQAAGLSTAAIAVGGFATTLLASLHNRLSPLVIASVVLGGVCLIVAFGVAFGSRDTQKNLSRWFLLAAPRRRKRETRTLLGFRRDFDGAAEAIEPELRTATPSRARELICESLTIRVTAGRALARWREQKVRRAALWLVTGTGFLLLAGVLAAADV